MNLILSELQLLFAAFAFSNALPFQTEMGAGEGASPRDTGDSEAGPNTCSFTSARTLAQYQCHSRTGPLAIQSTPFMRVGAGFTATGLCIRMMADGTKPSRFHG
jgi:hypothetical protein